VNRAIGNRIVRAVHRLHSPAQRSLALLAFLLFASAAGHAADVSPHWSKSGCGTCHSTPAPTDSSDIRLHDYNTLCTDCHGDAADSVCPHPTNIPTRDPGSLQLPENYHTALVDERIVCTTCHAIKLQCTGGRQEHYLNPSFLRDGPFRSGQACFECHDTAQYQKVNPHQFDPGSKSSDCLFCHKNQPDPGAATPVQFRLSGAAQCVGCHAVVPHPLSVLGSTTTNTWTHLVVPPIAMLAHMKAAEDRTGIVLPLDSENGSISCTTCHNVHDPELPDYPLQTESGASNKLRMRDICEACHDK